jgi:hypothetical protein
MAKVLLKNVRLSYPDLFQPGTPPAGSTSGPKYGGQFIFAPGSDAYKVASAELVRVATEKFGKNAPAILAELPKDKKCMRKGDGNLDKEGNVRNGYVGMFYITARNKTRPIVVDRDKSPLVEADGKPYGGCYVNVTVDIYAHDKPGLGKRVDATLLAVQFVSDGEAFGGSKGSADDFDEIEDDGEKDSAVSSSVDTSDLF